MSLIPERDVSNESISAYLTSQAVYNLIEDDGEIYVRDKNLGFPFWIRVERPFKLLIFNTYIAFGTSERAECALERAQRTMYGLLTPHFYLDDCDLHALYNMSYREGVVDAHIFDAACRFSECFMRAKGSPGAGDDFRTLH